MINFKPILFTIGLTLSKLALFMWMPTLLAFFTGTPGLAEFLAAVILTHIAAFICLHVGHKEKFRLGVRDMFVLTSAVWGDGVVDNPAGTTIAEGDSVRFIPFTELL